MVNCMLECGILLNDLVVSFNKLKAVDFYEWKYNYDTTTTSEAAMHLVYTLDPMLDSPKSLWATVIKYFLCENYTTDGSWWNWRNVYICLPLTATAVLLWVFVSVVFRLPIRHQSLPSTDHNITFLLDLSNHLAWQLFAFISNIRHTLHC